MQVDLRTLSLADAAPQWMHEHLRLYIDSDGADGHLWDSTERGGPGPLPTLLLVTTGAKSGQPKIAPLLYREVNGGFVIIASKGGAPAHPAWFHNLSANPGCFVQVERRKFNAVARVASGGERQRLWDEMAIMYSPYVDYQNKTEREIPVVVLDPTA